MAFVLRDRVKETTSSTGTGSVTLAGAASGFQSFSVIGNGNTTYYAIVGTAEWEVGIGTYTSSGTTLSRDTVLESSNGGSLVNFSAGTKDVFVTYPAERAVYLDASGDLGIGAEPQAGTILQATGATGAATDVRITNSGTAATDSVRLYLTTSTTGTTATNSQIIFGDGANVNAGSILYQHGNDSLTFRSNGATDRMVLLSDSTVCVNNSTALGANGNMVVTGTIMSLGYTHSPFMQAQFEPIVLNANTTLTATHLSAGIIQSPISGTLTLPTGTTLDAAIFSGATPTNVSFDWCVVNTGVSTITIAANTNHTISGTATVTASAIVATFRTRKTAANTYITYRIT